MALQAPKYGDLRKVAPERLHLELTVQIVTPVLGGAAASRQIDEVDVIRVPEIRGQLRFWWRALYGQRYRSGAELFAAESAIWGRAAGEAGGRSEVEVSLRVQDKGETEGSDLSPQDDAAYALWPARGERQRRTPPAPRRKPGTKFRLVIKAPLALDAELRDTVRSWLLFGGYGGRTRRGAGSLTTAPEWLPADATLVALHQLYGRDILGGRPALPGDMPLLAGAEMFAGTAVARAEAAWREALGWLREFRQGTKGEPGWRAREPGAGNRPGRSNWPEADKVRQLVPGNWSHKPRDNATPAWPRAAFGLPIVGRFQNTGQSGGHYSEPGDFTLRWRDCIGDSHDRLASALIVKSLPLRGGKFAPVALWLNRAYPEGVVYLDMGQAEVANSLARFNRLAAQGDQIRFKPLDGKPNLQQAFFDWLRARQLSRAAGTGR